MGNGTKGRKADKVRSRPSREGAATAEMARSPAGRIVCRHDVLIRKLQELSELDLTQRVLQPLLLAMGYDRVEYSGGPDEEGKDLICWGRGNFLDDELVVAAVKKYRPSGKASDPRSFSEIVTQMSQAAEKEVPTAHGRVRPSRVLLVTPYPIETRVLRSRFEAYESLRHRHVSFVGGDELAKLVLKHVPAIASQLTGPEFDIIDSMRHQLNNDPLLNALGASQRRDLGTFYTDIDFSVGKRATRQFFRATFSGQRLSLTVTQTEWEEVARANRDCHEYFGVHLLTQPEHEIRTQQSAAVDQYNSWLRETRNARDRMQASEAEIQEHFSAFREVYDEVKKIKYREEGRFSKDKEAVQNHEQALKRAKLRLDKEHEGTEGLRDAKRDYDFSLRALEMAQTRLGQLERYSVHDIGALVATADELWKRVRHSEAGVLEAKDRLRELREAGREKCVCIGIDLDLGPNYVDELISRLFAAVGAWEAAKFSLSQRGDRVVEPTFPITLDGTGLVRVLMDNRQSVLRQIQRLNSRSPGNRSLVGFVLKCERLLTGVSSVLSNRHVALAAGVAATAESGPAEESRRLCIPIHRVFDTGVNVVVLGDAGAGKTTSLQMYAMKRIEDPRPEELCIFIPLAAPCARAKSNRTEREQTLAFQSSNRISPLT